VTKINPGFSGTDIGAERLGNGWKDLTETERK